MNRPTRTRPDSIFDPMLQHERTALAWERTAVATMVAGTLLARYAADIHRALAVLGVAQVVFGAALLVWTGLHYEQLHASVRRGESPVHPNAARLVGASTVAFCGAATIIGIAMTITRR